MVRRELGARALSGRATTRGRRRFLGATAGGAALALVAACGGGGKESASGGATSGSAPAARATETNAQPKRGGVLTIQGGSELAGRALDPHVNVPTIGRTLRFWYQGLLAYDLRTYEVKPELAEKWEQPSPTELVFKLRPGVKWHDKPPVNGRELTADDVVFALNRARGSEPRFTNRSALASVDQIQAVDKSTVKLTLKGADATVLSKLSSDGVLILAPEAVEKFQKVVTPEEVIGTGPFMLKTLELQVSAESTRHPNYWKAGQPYLDTIRLRQFADDQAAYAAFTANSLDVIRYVPGAEVKGFLARQGRNVQPDWFEDDTAQLITPNLKLKPMDDPRVTRALRLLTDYDEFVGAWAETWLGKGRFGSVLPTALGPWDLTDDEYKQIVFWKSPKDAALREAFSLLAAAGYTKDNPLRFELTTYGERGTYTPACGELLHAQWKRLSQGVLDVPLKLVDQATSVTVRANKTFTYMNIGVVTLNEPDAWLSEHYTTTGSQNNMSFSDAKIDDLITKQRSELDLGKRKAQVKEIVRALAENAPFAIGANRYILNGVSPKVRGRAPEFHLKGGQYDGVWLDA